jgi:chromosome segregation ATPase
MVFEKPESEEEQPYQEEKVVTPKATSSVDKSDAIDPDIYSDLMSSIQNGVYTQFYEMVNSLKEDITDEAACYRAAFKAVKKSNPITVEKLMLKVDDCITALNGKRQEWSEALEEKKSSIKSKSSQILDKQKQMDELQQQINALHAESLSITTEIKSMQAKIDKVNADFDRTAKSVETTLVQNKRKLSNYLKGGDK